MADLKNTITAGNARLWSDDLLQFYPNGSSLKYGPNAADVYNTDTYPLVTEFTDTMLDGEFKILSGAAGQLLYDIATDNKEKLELLTDTSSLDDYVPRTNTINGYDYVDTDEIVLTKDDVGLDKVSNYFFSTCGNSPTNYSSTSYVATKANWVPSDNDNPDRSVVQHAKRFDSPVNITITGAVSGEVTDWYGDTDINISTNPNSSQTLTLTGDATGTTTFNDLGDASLNVTINGNNHTHSNSTILSIDASKILSGTISSLRLPNTIGSNTTGSAARCTGNSATASIADQVDIRSSASNNFYPLLWSIGDSLYTSRSILEASGTGNIRCSGDLTTSFSDERLKNVKEYLNPTEALNNVCKWKKVRYTANDIAKEYGNYDTSKVEIGLLANEIAEQYPEMVQNAPFDRNYNDESISGENYKTLHYDRIVAIQAAAIEGLNIKLTQAINEIESLKMPWYKKIYNKIFK